MGRLPSKPRTIGKISLRQLESGAWEASTRVYDADANPHAIRVRRPSEKEAMRASLDKADLILNEGSGKITAGMTVAQAVDAWLMVVRARAPRLSQRTIRLYEYWGADLVAQIGRKPLRDLATPGDCEAVILAAHKRSKSAATTTKKALSLLLGTAARHGAIANNPVRDTERLEGSEKIESFLDPSKLPLLLEWVRTWRINQRGGVQPDRALLADAICLTIGTSARPSELLAMRRVDFAENYAKVSIRGKVVNQPKVGAVRENFPKQRRQSRVVTLPKMAQKAALRRAEYAPVGEEMTIFATSSGRCRSVSNLERLLRTFRDDHAAQIESVLNIPLDEFTWKLFRRTAATLVDSEAGIDLAAGLLGHADTATTRRHYAVKLPEVDPRTAEILDAALGSIDGATPSPSPSTRKDSPAPPKSSSLQTEHPSNVIPFPKRHAR